MPSFYFGRCFGPSTPASSGQECLPLPNHCVNPHLPFGEATPRFKSPAILRGSPCPCTAAVVIVQKCSKCHEKKVRRRNQQLLFSKITQFGESQEPACSLSSCHSSAELIYFKINYRPSCKTLYWQLLKMASPSSS